MHAKDNQGHTAFIVASLSEQKAIMKLLIGAGADVNAKGDNGHTAFMLASLSGYKEIVEF